MARPAPAFWNVLKTLMAIALFDAVVVWGIPTLTLRVQHGNTGLDLFFPPQVGAGEILLGMGTALVLWAGIVLAIRGGGTPFPFDAPHNLVVVGPYARLRAPMVTGTLIQLVGVGLISGSIIILFLFLVVALLWNTFIRPTEEDTLHHAFGREFETYRRNVRCWLPRRSAWKKPPADFHPVSLSDMPVRAERRHKHRP